jgi:hypothetical protein
MRLVAATVALLVTHASPGGPPPSARAPSSPAGPVDAARPDRPVLTGFDPPSGRRVTLRLDEAAVGEALRNVAEAAGWSIVMPSGLRGAITADLRDAPAEDALRAILRQHALEATLEGGVVTVTRAAGASGAARRFELATPDVEAELTIREPDATAPAREAGSGESRARGEDQVLSGDQVLRADRAAGDVVVLRGNLRLEPGASAARAVAVLGSVQLGPGANVADDVVAVGGDVRVLPGARVGHDAVSVGGRVIVDAGGEVAGQKVSVGFPGVAGLFGTLGARPLDEAPRSPLAAVARAIALFAVLFVAGLLLLSAAPLRVERVGAALVNAPLQSVVAGLLATLALPLLALLLVLTLVGIPLVAVEVVAVLAAGVFGLVALAVRIGRAMPLPPGHRLRAFELALGTAAIVLLTRVPVLGVLVWVAAWLATFGAVVRTAFGRAPSLDALPTTPLAPPPPRPR